MSRSSLLLLPPLCFLIACGAGRVVGTSDSGAGDGGAADGVVPAQCTDVADACDAPEGGQGLTVDVLTRLGSCDEADLVTAFTECRG